MSSSLWIMVGFFFLLSFSAVHAQVPDSNDPVWDAINGILVTLGVHREKIGDLITRISLLKDEFYQFADDTNANFLVMTQTTEGLQDQINITNGSVQANTNTLVDHNQQLEQLVQADIVFNQVDQNLQNQISGLGVGVERTRIYEIVNMDLNSNIALCDDADDILMFGYCAGGLMGQPYSSFAKLYDDFSDYEFTSNPTWNVLAGSMYIGGPGSGLLNGKLACSNTNFQCEMVTPTPFTSQELSFGFDFMVPSGYEDMSLLISNSGGLVGPGTHSGYFLLVHAQGPSSYIAVVRTDSGIPSNTYFHQVSGVNFVAQTEYNVRAERDSTGFWNIFLNDQQLGQGPVDNTYSQFTYTHARIFSQGASAITTLDRIEVNDVDFNASTSAMVNIDNYNEPLGIRCMQNGSARAVCMRVN